jgi:hypothetical protein
VRSQVKSSQATLGMLHAGVDQKRLKCNIFKTLFRSVRLGRVEADASARSAETTATSDVAETPIDHSCTRQLCSSQCSCATATSDHRSIDTSRGARSDAANEPAPRRALAPHPERATAQAPSPGFRKVAWVLVLRGGLRPDPVSALYPDLGWKHCITVYPQTLRVVFPI